MSQCSPPAAGGDLGTEDEVSFSKFLTSTLSYITRTINLLRNLNSHQRLGASFQESPQFTLLHRRFLLFDKSRVEEHFLEDSDNVRDNEDFSFCFSVHVLCITELGEK